MCNKYIILLSVVLLTSCKTSRSTDVPSISKIKIRIDGFFNVEEWDKSKIIDITSNNSLYLIQDDDYLFLGIKNNEDVGRYIDLYLDNDSIGTINLHASMQLGERQLYGNWNDTIPGWNWGNNLKWTANIVEVVNETDQITFLESVENYEGFEFQISKNKIRSKKVRIRFEIKDFVGQASEIVFPLNSVRMKTEDWLLLELK